MEQFYVCFSELEDPRAANAQHDLTEVPFVALAAVLCGAEGCSDMADFGRAKEGQLRQVLRLAHGVPSHDTFSRVFRMLDPQVFEAAFRRFVAGFAAAIRLEGVVALDGKAVSTARRSGGVCARSQVDAAAPGQCLGCRGAPGAGTAHRAWPQRGGRRAGGPATPRPRWLHRHRGRAALPREMAQAIRDRGADYVLALKENQSALWADARRRIDAACRRDEAESVRSTSHGCIERRHVTVVRAANLARRHDFPAIRAVARLITERHCDGRTETRTRHFLLSRSFAASRPLAIIHEHWGIENRLHWVLDVAFNEDRA